MAETAATGRAVATSAELGRAAVAVLDRVVDALSESVDAAGSIGTATAQQRTGTRQLVTAVAEVQDVAVRFSDVAATAVSSSERLDALGQSLLEAGRRVRV